MSNTASVRTFRPTLPVMDITYSRRLREGSGTSPNRLPSRRDQPLLAISVPEPDPLHSCCMSRLCGRWLVDCSEVYSASRQRCCHTDTFVDAEQESGAQPRRPATRVQNYHEAAQDDIASEPLGRRFRTPSCHLAALFGSTQQLNRSAGQLRGVHVRDQTPGNAVLDASRFPLCRTRRPVRPPLRIYQCVRKTFALGRENADVENTQVRSHVLHASDEPHATSDSPESDRLRLQGDRQLTVTQDNEMSIWHGLGHQCRSFDKSVHPFDRAEVRHEADQGCSLR